MVVLPSAASAARMSDAPARRSPISTAAPTSFDGPKPALLFEIRMRFKNGTNIAGPNEGAVYLEAPTQCFRTIYIYGTLALDRSRANLSFNMLLGNDIEVASMSGTATNSQIDASTHARGRGYPISLLLKR